MKCFVGLDVSSTKLDVCIMSNDTELGVLYAASLTNDMIGASEIKEQVLSLNEKYEFNRVVIGMEATSLYSFHPCNVLPRRLGVKAARSRGHGGTTSQNKEIS